MSIELLKALKDELQKDIDRPEGRWGVHGHSTVDDDYFSALEYVVKRITEIEALSRTSQPVQAAVPDVWKDDWKKQVMEMWKCVRKHDSSIPDDYLDLMRDCLLSAAPTPPNAENCSPAVEKAWARFQAVLKDDDPMKVKADSAAPEPDFWAYVCNKHPEHYQVWRERAPAGPIDGWVEYGLYKSRPFQSSAALNREWFEKVQRDNGATDDDLAIEHGEYTFSPIQKQWQFFMLGQQMPSSTKPQRITEQDAREIALNAITCAKTDVSGWVSFLDKWSASDELGGLLAKLNENREPDYKARTGIPEELRVRRAGQINVGDTLSFELASRRICTTAKEVLNAGTNREEIIYNRKKNHYFITSMVIDGTSTHKNVFVVPAPAIAKHEGGNNGLLD